MLQQIGIKNDVSKLQQILGSKLYSNKYSFIQEQCQNSADAMRKCGKTDEFFDIGIKKEEDNFVFYIRDFGCSFDSVEHFKQMMALMESSKSQVKDSSETQEIGKYGIGSISVAAYNNNWLYKIYKDGKGFDAKLKEIEGKGIFVECGDYYDTDERTGVYFEVVIKESPYVFFGNILEKIKYFQNVKINLDSFTIEYIHRNSGSWHRVNLVNINENFKVYKSDDFVYSTLNRKDSIHICLDQYSYDINWEVLGIEKINLPIALKFGLNELEVTPTREVISLTDDYKDKIIAKLEKVAKWFLDKYNEQNPVFECNSFVKFFNELNSRHLKIVKLDRINFDIKSFCSKFNLNNFNNPTFKGISVKTFDEFNKFLNRNISRFYNCKYTIYSGTVERYISLTYGWHDYKLYMIEDKFSMRERSYYKSLIDSTKRYFITKNEEMCFSREGTKVSFLSHKGLAENEVESTEQLELLKREYDQFQMLKEEFEKCIPLSKNNVPANYITKEPKKRVTKERLSKGEGDIVIKYPRKMERYSSKWDAVWEDKAVPVRDLYKQPALHIYGTESQRSQLESLFKVFDGVKNVKVIMTKNDNVLEEMDLHNFISIKQLKNDFSVLSKYVTASIIAKEIENDKVIKNKGLISEYISTNIGLKLAELDGYMTKYALKELIWRVDSQSESVVTELVNFYKTNPKMMDQEIVACYNECKSALDKLDFIQFFANAYSNRTRNTTDWDIALKNIREICRLKQVRMNWDFYALDKIDEFFNVEKEELVEV